MKRTENQSIAHALHTEMERAQNTIMETRGMFLLTAGYVRSLPVLDYTPSGQDVDFVAFFLEKFGERLDAEHSQMRDAADAACHTLNESKPTKAVGQTQNP